MLQLLDSNGHPVLTTALQSKVVTSGSIIYIGEAQPGTATSQAAWRAKKIDQTDPNNILTKWADGGNFSQVATDLTVLTYA